MNLAEIEYSVHEALDAGDPDTLEMFAAHCAENLAELGEVLCAAIIGTDHRAWASVMAVAAQKSPGLADALESIEAHIDRRRASFIESRARNIADAAEHDMQCLAELQAELNGECRV